ncbi:hypothetical protein LPJ66_000053 [Kickxella alabastrina]|uniref:Uncharacterized protein n=1 Tax=Kickxella alabastrina TaxID=61397 RepID=A0ACC1IXA1_9FUNG|nr:hypothetical protein LPJ66_000053 [Kickxella alabastrina]
MRVLLTIAIAATIASVASHPIGTRSLASPNHVNPLTSALHFEVVEHSGDNPNNVSRLSHTIVNDNANRVHSNVVQRVSIGDNNVVGQLNNNLVVQGVHGVVVTGTGNIIGNKENEQDDKKDNSKKGAENPKGSQPVPKSP